jgi:orotate phosphoribosyltransferase
MMDSTINAGETLAGYLLQIKAIKLNVQQPFTWASGLKSPIYCDNRTTLSFPELRSFIKEQFVRTIKQNFDNTELIAGVATGGIAQGAMVADALGLPFAYVRSDKKAHGLTNQVEGIVNAGQRVVVIEDLVSTGGSSLNAVKALRDMGANVLGMCAIFTYGLAIASSNFANLACPLYSLTNFETLLQKARIQNYIGQHELESLLEWQKNPADWGRQ